ncbi:dTDP-rhamnosyl transferase [Buttiauxella noackiae ATCC 51607]|uniref:dTDP-rhamnosyl transferase n=1 Tax=Buttiauxella noackiae ATCC 51607 TaxID=1354255 RepID=A0A1B7HPF1_9ENTR|nr:glycosyltransferase [Buttiauxella noackiae]OAT17494.1 dTDP-rhamnosyl transferase [Buttiauxella noackiae ATCC 51607]
MEHKVIAVVVTYNRKEFLLKVLKSLIEQTYQLQHILVIDNSSSDGTKEAVFSISDAKIEYMNTGGNLGGAGGFYEGFKLSENYTYDYLWLMDDDFQPSLNCLETMLKNDPKGIVQPIRYNLDGSCAELSPLTYDIQKIFTLNPKGKSVKSYIQDQGDLSQPIKIEAIPFEGPLIHRDVVTLLGKPEPRFFIFCDDIEYAIKAKKAGVPIVCDPNAKATRLLVNNQGNDMLSWKGYFMLRNLFYLHRKYGENVFVRNKPIVLALGYGVVSLLKGNWKQIRVTYEAFFDSKELKNTEKHKPKPKKNPN